MSNAYFDAVVAEVFRLGGRMDLVSRQRVEMCQAPHAVGFADVADPVAANQARTYTREGNNFRLSNVAHTRMQVRRLTPRECERLQGFPDDYTLIPYRGKPAADGPRYKALGNSMAVPVMLWIGQRIAQVEAAS
jgi:site-specific DNA-cytosine methylase